jgi:hypothetical protein
MEETGRIEKYGVWPVCKKHKHITRNAATRMVGEDTHRFVGGRDTLVQYISAIVPVKTGKLWQPVPCHDETGAAIMGLRTWGARAAV